MTRRRFVLAPEAAEDLVAIWRFIKNRASVQIADRVEAEIRKRIFFLTKNPQAGHWRTDLTSERVRFFAVYSYLVVYQPESRPLQVVAILHGNLDVEHRLLDRL